MAKIDSSGTSPVETSEMALVITRVFDAPRELVWKAWTDPAHVAQWFGPHNFTSPVCEIDPRPGGALRIVMRGPAGDEYPMVGVFHEVVEPERLVMTTRAVEGADGTFQLEVLNTVSFDEHDGGKTKLTMHARIVRSSPEAGGALAGMEEGWKQTLDRLAGILAKVREAA